MLAIAIEILEGANSVAASEDGAVIVETMGYAGERLLRVATSDSVRRKGERHGRVQRDRQRRVQVRERMRSRNPAEKAIVVRDRVEQVGRGYDVRTGLRNSTSQASGQSRLPAISGDSGIWLGSSVSGSRIDCSCLRGTFSRATACRSPAQFGSSTGCHCSSRPASTSEGPTTSAASDTVKFDLDKGARRSKRRTHAPLYIATIRSSNALLTSTTAPRAFARSTACASRIWSDHANALRGVASEHSCLRERVNGIAVDERAFPC